MSGIVLDAGGLIAVDREQRAVLLLLAEAMARGRSVTVPATALAQVIRRPARQARLSRLIRAPGVHLRSLDGRDATAVGVLLAQTSTTDTTNAHVVVCARERQDLVVSSAPNDLRRLDPSLRVYQV